ncbi:hypothetical protein AAFF_G00418160 [Aldrovandia affinis]|uniref:Uncharacterized protein n=1 Tax=Aldrovandia affinis TaxID=143900 RepID=A0AAD7WJB5_9TELE|nr:hypothetical protein AAFF_G00418160 [Aldrovandia affinis]
MRAATLAGREQSRAARSSMMAAGLALLLLAQVTGAFPGRLDWRRGAGPRGACGECRLERCPAGGPQCPAGRVQDACGCCWQCGNGEGQLCDPDPSSAQFYGRCGEGLRCRDPLGRTGEGSQGRCVCARQELLCGSDGKTYDNSCQLRAARYRLSEDDRLMVAHPGPCTASKFLILLVPISPHCSFIEH